MKLCVAIVHSRDKGRVTDELVRAGFKFTILNSTGGFLREGNATFLVGVEPDEVATLTALLAEFCQSREQVVTVAPVETGPQGGMIANPIKVPVGGGVMFVLDVEQFYRF